MMPRPSCWKNFQTSLVCAECMYFLILMTLLMLFLSHKLHLQHNARSEPVQQVDDDQNSTKDEFYDVEMTIDDTFDANPEDIETGKFISFRYAGEYVSGPPMNPRIYSLRSDITSWDQLLHSKRKQVGMQV